MRIQLSDGSYEYVSDTTDFINLVDQRMGLDARNYISDKIIDLEQKADYETNRLDTDCDSYESSLESANSAACDMNELVVELMEYISKAKKMDRSKILDKLNSTHMLYQNNF